MRTKSTVVLSMLAGVALGALAVNGLKAQDKGLGAYTVFAFTDIGDPAAYKANVVEKAAPEIKKHGGKTIVASNNVTTLREPALQRLVIIAWDNAQQAKDWYGSDEMKVPRAYFEQHSSGPVALADALSQ